MAEERKSNFLSIRWENRKIFHFSRCRPKSFKRNFPLQFIMSKPSTCRLITLDSISISTSFYSFNIAFFSLTFFSSVCFSTVLSRLLLRESVKKFQKILELVSRLFRPQYNIFQLILLIIITFYPFEIAAIRTPCQCWWTLLTRPFDFNRNFAENIYYLDCFIALVELELYKRVEECGGVRLLVSSKQEKRSIFLCFFHVACFFFISIDDDVNEDVRLSRVKKQKSSQSLCYVFFSTSYNRHKCEM